MILQVIELEKMESLINKSQDTIIKSIKQQMVKNKEQDLKN